MSAVTLDRCCIVTDEVTADPAAAISMARLSGIRRLELRHGGTSRFPDFTEEQIRSIEDALQTNGATLVGVSPGLFKSALMSTETSEDRLRRALNLACRLGAPTLTFFAPAPHDLPMLCDAVERCRSVGVEPLLENGGADTWIGGSGLRRLLDQTGFGLVWDPANAVAAGEDRPDLGLSGLLGHVRRVHVKNFDPVTQQCVDIDAGVVDWPAQLKALHEGGYEGLFTIEPHQPDRWTSNLRRLLELRW